MKITLKAARVNAGLSQTDIGRLLKRSKDTVLNWEKGRTRISAQELKTLCEIYKCTSDDIFLPEALP